jgi:phosphatidylglycerol:prolipoprotein diacylglycerol transferase
MWPVWAQLDVLGRPLLVTGYGVFALLGAVLGTAVCVHFARRLGVDRFDAFAAAALAIAFGAVGARLLFVAVSLPQQRNWGEALALAFAPGGLVWYGGLAAGAAAAIVYLRSYRLSLAAFADAAAPGLALGHALGRVGCFMAGCCYGRPTGLPWGVRFPASALYAGPVDVPLHPVQLYEAGAELVLAAVAARLVGRVTRGGAFLAWLCGYAAVRLGLELFVRGDDRGAGALGLSPSALLSLAALAAAGLALALRRGGLTTETKVS